MNDKSEESDISMCGSWLAGLAPPGSSVSCGGDTDMPPEQLRLCVRAVLSPSSFSRSPDIFTVSCLLCVAFPELLKHASPSAMLSFILYVRPLLGGVACAQPSLHVGEPGKLPPFLPRHGDTGHLENAQLSPFFDHYCTCKMLGLSTQDKRDAPESEETHDREDGQPEVLNPTRGPPAHGGQHARPAGHHSAGAAAPELVASEDTDHGVWEQRRRWASHTPSVTFPSHVILTLPVAERSQSSFQEKAIGLFLGGWCGGVGSNSLII